MSALINMSRAYRICKDLTKASIQHSFPWIEAPSVLSLRHDILIPFLIWFIKMTAWRVPQRMDPRKPMLGRDITKQVQNLRWIRKRQKVQSFRPNFTRPSTSGTTRWTHGILRNRNQYWVRAIKLSELKGCRTSRSRCRPLPILSKMPSSLSKK